MGTVPSRPLSENSDVIFPNWSAQDSKKLNQTAYPNFFEAASMSLAKQAEPVPVPQKRSASVGQLSNNSYKKERRKWASSSEGSSSISTHTRSPTLSSSTTTSFAYKESQFHAITMDPKSNMKIKFEMIGGRRYQSSPGSHFFLPCDDEEADRLVVMHFLLKYAFNGNVTAPIIESLRAKVEKNKDYRPQALDVGCGSGSWILEMATEFPNTDFHGIDLRTMFPSTIKPQNTTFLQHDFLMNLPYPDESFEFVRMRSMLGFMTQTQLLRLLAEIQRVLKPSGYIEILDVEYKIHRPGPISESVLNQQLQSTMHKQGIEFMAGHHLSTLLMTQQTHGGLVDVHQHKVTIPIGWGGQLGQVHAQNLQALLQSLHPDIKQGMTTIANDVDSLFAESIKECTQMQSHMNWFVCFGQKPAKNMFTYNDFQNLIPNVHPSSGLLTPLDSPNGSTLDSDDNNWDSIHDFVEGYTD